MRFTVAFIAGLSLGCLVVPTNGYASFRDRIPNGYIVSNPCSKDLTWDGVGHENSQGGGTLNDFGDHFRELGKSWNGDICMMDSDGDGMTNGYELGDPDCKWMVGDTPSRSFNITHPGLCDPFDSDKCRGRNGFLDCEDEVFVCPQISGADVTRQELKFLEFIVPHTETNYYCMTFELPDDQDYHVFATEPLVVQKELVHHMLIYGCSDENVAKIETPTKCGMEANEDCQTLIGLWTLGSVGTCYGDLGFRIGQSSIKRVKVEIHYNNPMSYKDLTDSSGMAMYYKPAKEGVQDLITLWTGTTLMEIPPGEKAYEVTSYCKKGCTSSIINEPAKIWGAANHMHYYGTAMRIELFRDGEKVADVTWDERFEYDDPAFHMHEPALDLLPGDELKTTCIYNTEKTDSYVRYGEATSDEMCFGFIIAYPESAFSDGMCLGFNELDMCEIYSGTPINTPMGLCYWYSFTTSYGGYTPSWMTQVGEHCTEEGHCGSQCKTTVENLLNTEPCLTQEASLMVSFILEETKVGHRAMAAVNTCRGLIWSEKDDHSSNSDVCTWDDCAGICGV